MTTTKNSNRWYVYAAYVEGVLRYVGKGKGNRYKHCNSGKSSCYRLNEDHFSGKSIVVEKIFEDLNEREAVEYESYILNEYKGKGLYNIQIGKSPTTKKRQAVKKWSTYYLALFSHVGTGERQHVRDVEQAISDAATNRPYYHHSLTCKKSIMPLLGFVKEVHEKRHYWKRLYTPFPEEVVDAIFYYYNKEHDNLRFPKINMPTLLECYHPQA
jgi:hypothetical protein